MVSAGGRINTMYHQNFTAFNGETQCDVIYLMRFIEYFDAEGILSKLKSMSPEEEI